MGNMQGEKKFCLNVTALVQFVRIIDLSKFICPCLLFYGTHLFSCATRLFLFVILCFPMPLPCSRVLLFLSRVLLVRSFVCFCLFSHISSMYTQSYPLDVFIKDQIKLIQYKSCYRDKDLLNTKNKLKCGASFFKWSTRAISCP